MNFTQRLQLSGLNKFIKFYELVILGILASHKIKQIFYKDILKLSLDFRIFFDIIISKTILTYISDINVFKNLK